MIGSKSSRDRLYTEEDIAAVFATAGLEVVNIEYAMHQQYSRGAAREESALPLKQMLVTGRVL
ncbi:MAG: hypothetical protein AB1916_16350 [Thermodesulfobacteriota bacterium]